ncbi:unnamed protein product [Amoebophrya sp. A25]|nr:unnamed protein product [Amoebophrya sp. A25]|eukprot:GSA25T00015392001.1
MINDETNWHILNQGFCSFKVKLKQPPQTFCRNEYNVTGLCNRVSCPLANSEYATVLEKEGLCYLYIKTVERAHSPKNLWEKIELSKNFMQALKQIDEHLMHWADHKKNRCKQRLTKLRQVLLRQRKAALAPKLTTSVGIKKKTERREATREAKAEKAAKVENAIEKELLDRLRLGTYGDLYKTLGEHNSEANKDQDAEMLDQEELSVDDDEIQQMLEMEDEDEKIDERDLEYVADLGDDQDDEDDDFGIPDEDLSDLSDDEQVDDEVDGDLDTSRTTTARDGGDSDEDGASLDNPRSGNTPGASSSSKPGKRKAGRRSTDIGDMEDVLGARKPKRKAPAKNIEYEVEEEGPGREKLLR